MQTAHKEKEARAVEWAKGYGFPLPPGELVPGEEPDFQVVGGFGRMGLEVTHAVPLPRNDSFNSALAENAYYERVVGGAEAIYRAKLNAPTVKATVSFWYFKNERGARRRMEQELAQFVIDHVPDESEHVSTFTRHDSIPDGFCVISIARDEGKWFCGGDVTLTVSGIYETLANRISEKNQRVVAYREKLPGHSDLAVDIQRSVDTWRPIHSTRLRKLVRAV